MPIRVFNLHTERANVGSINIFDIIILYENQ